MFEIIMFGIAIGYVGVSALMGTLIGAHLTAVFNGYSGLDAVISTKDSVYFSRILQVRAQFRQLGFVMRVLYTVLTFFVGFVVAATVWPASVFGK